MAIPGAGGSFNVNLCTIEVEVADFEGNGRDDILVMSNPPGYPNNDRILLGLSEGNGFFGGATIYTPNGRPYDTAVADFNGDGRSDFVRNFYNINSFSQPSQSRGAEFTQRVKSQAVSASVSAALLCVSAVR
jgi:hypothetical protein